MEVEQTKNKNDKTLPKKSKTSIPANSANVNNTGLFSEFKITNNNLEAINKTRLDSSIKLPIIKKEITDKMAHTSLLSHIKSNSGNHWLINKEDIFENEYNHREDEFNISFYNSIGDIDFGEDAILKKDLQNEKKWSTIKKYQTNDLSEKSETSKNKEFGKKTTKKFSINKSDTLSFADHSQLNNLECFTNKLQDKNPGVI
jgi:hypothetical protein